MTRETFLAGLSESGASQSNSIEGVTARLLRWGRIAPAGLARVEYASLASRNLVLEALRLEYQAQNILFHEIELAPDTPALQHVIQLRETLGKLPPGVVSITGLANAFPDDVPLLESLGVLNFNRDTLVHFPLRQIWWMQSDMSDAFRLYNHDFDRFFLVRLQLLEMAPSSKTPQLSSALPESDLPAYEEAKQISDYYLERFMNALRAHRSINDLHDIFQNVVKPLSQAGLTRDEIERKDQMLGELEKFGYDLDSYFEEELELEKEENMSELAALRSG